jgi:lactoylglutathione lyase
VFQKQYERHYARYYSTKGIIMSPSILNLIVLRTADLDTALSFYGAFGLEFLQEQHGAGPIHYSCTQGALVIELYPGKPGIAPDRKYAGATMIGFQVSDLNSVIERLTQQERTIITPPQDSAWGRRALVQDPDGRSVELTQQK